ncbi:WXG100 family type VII secretion target [Thermoactinomyces sp. DSM 45891]|uniref:WXG100 family type VII secretion target n=1 Tax=Thermoactinomyces sp. DSM 45891 TaxID=1761907 RepID=UPI00090F6C11|nr:WXG100 family type VII secretion target [Thermoactinomyces sp. DSM 45891]SFX76111.1 WXG100 family type VII secretion target [Thermoactinomyces sp. DSM 45891]
MRIQITPDQVEAAAKEFQAKRDESEQIINTLSNRISSMEGQWEGMTRNKFVQEFDQAKNNMKQFTTLLESISQSLNQIATKFRQTDGM